MSAFTSSNLNKEKSSIELFVDDFEVQNWDISVKAKEILHRSRNTFFSLYCIDFVLCHIVIGRKYLFLSQIRALQYVNLYVNDIVINKARKSYKLHCTLHTRALFLI